MDSREGLWTQAMVRSGLGCDVAEILKQVFDQDVTFGDLALDGHVDLVRRGL